VAESSLLQSRAESSISIVLGRICKQNVLMKKTRRIVLMRPLANGFPTTLS